MQEELVCLKQSVLLTSSPPVATPQRHPVPKLLLQQAHGPVPMELGHLSAARHGSCRIATSNDSSKQASHQSIVKVAVKNAKGQVYGVQDQRKDVVRLGLNQIGGNGFKFAFGSFVWCADIDFESVCVLSIVGVNMYAIKCSRPKYRMFDGDWFVESKLHVWNE